MHHEQTDSTRRFSNRVENYVRYRPGYPDGVLHVLREETGLNTASQIADIGSGTGISSELFLSNGNSVFGVEPNPEMRHVAEALLQGYPQFHSIDGTAEVTTLPGQSADYVIAGQAFHWFDMQKAKQEFIRILRPGGRAVLMWNSRRTNSTPFLRAYEALLQRYGTDYREVQHKNIGPEVLRAFFGGGKLKMRTLYNEQQFDFAGLKGRLLSSSYTPDEAHLNYRPMLQELEHIFEQYRAEGKVRFEYDTEIYFGYWLDESVAADR
ncbi:MAG: class I SAM-dependent methyltransferase [Gammaproteobacteria bacterium]